MNLESGFKKQSGSPGRDMEENSIGAVSSRGMKLKERRFPKVRRGLEGRKTSIPAEISLENCCGDGFSFVDLQIGFRRNPFEINTFLRNVAVQMKGFLILFKQLVQVLLSHHQTNNQSITQSCGVLEDSDDGFRWE